MDKGLIKIVPQGQRLLSLEVQHKEDKMRWFFRAKNTKQIETHLDPFAALIDRLKQDGLTDEATRLNVLLHETAWTTGSEFLGEFGLAMKGMRKSIRCGSSTETKAAFRSAAKVVKKVWPFIFW